MLTHIADSGSPGGILLYSVKPPTREELNEAVLRFHEFPLVGDNIPFVVLERPENLTPSDIAALRKIKMPGFENLNDLDDLEQQDVHHC